MHFMEGIYIMVVSAKKWRQIMKHDFKKIEPKWQKKWDDARIFQAVDND